VIHALKSSTQESLIFISWRKMYASYTKWLENVLPEWCIKIIKRNVLKCFAKQL